MMLERFNSVFTSSIIPPFPTSIPHSETQFQFSEIARLIIQFAVVKNILFKGLSSILQKFPSLFIVKTNFFFKHWVILNCDSCCLITTLRAIRLHNSFHQEEQMVKFTHNNNINYRSSRPKMIWKMLLWIIDQNFHKNTRLRPFKFKLRLYIFSYIFVTGITPNRPYFNYWVMYKQLLMTLLSALIVIRLLIRVILVLPFVDERSGD